MKFSFIQTAEGPVRYAQAGRGPDVVLLHGAMSSLEDMVLGPFDRLAERFRVTAFDRPGHGETPRGRLQGAPSRQASRLLEAMATLGLNDVIVVGQSFGAAIAMSLALLDPARIKGVLAISPIAFPELRTEHLLYGARAIVGAGDILAYGPGRMLDAVLTPMLWRAIFAPHRMPDRFAEHYPFALASGASQMLALGEEAVLSLPDLAVLHLDYPQCRQPVIVLAGSHDWISPPWTHAARLAGAAPGAELRLLPGQGHMLHHIAISEVVAAVDTLAFARDQRIGLPPVTATVAPDT
jgi:pimeloyl-ACP methyl ester carboxylesterase